MGQISEFIDTIFKIGNPDQIEILLLNKFTFSGLVPTLYFGGIV